MDIETIDTLIQKEIKELFDERELESSSNLEKSTVLLETGLDSLGYAILVTRLEETLGYDPFTLSPDPIYPRTYGEFLDLYVRFHPENAQNG